MLYLVYQEDPSLFLHEILFLEHTEGNVVWACFKIKDNLKLLKDQHSSSYFGSSQAKFFGSFGTIQEDSTIIYCKEGIEITEELKYELDDTASLYRWIAVLSDDSTNFHDIEGLLRIQDNEDFRLIETDSSDLGNTNFFFLLDDEE